MIHEFYVYRSDAFENPVLQQHYRNLEALALDMMAPEAIEDFTSKSLSNLVIHVIMNMYMYMKITTVRVFFSFF